MTQPGPEFIDSGLESDSDSMASDDDDTAPEPVNTSTTWTGDQVLAQSIMMMHDFMLAREMSLATASGDAGRVYEVLKVLGEYTDFLC